MIPHRVLAIDDASQIGDARRVAVQLAEGLGFDEADGGRVAIVVTEVATNLLRHARGGRLLIGRAEEGVQVLALDDGPGMADVAACMRDGFSTAGTPGNGLGAIRRLSSEFDVFSSPPGGTVMAVRIDRARAVPPAGAFRVAGVAIAAPGETVCGDAWTFVREGRTGRLLVADGLGHGPHAAEAADLAVAHFADGALPSLAAWLQQAHAPMRGTRGAAVSAARLDADAGTVALCGAGNVSVRVLSGVGDKTLLSQHGTLGVQIGRPQENVHPWPDHAFLVMHSDGIATRWDPSSAPGLLQRSPAVIAGWLLRDHIRGRDDATVVVVQRN